MIIVDQLNREIQLNGAPKRIVSLVPSQTELICDLGLENELVGITKFCVHPNHIRKFKTVVGGTKQVRLDKIKTLDPDIILCNKEENTEEMVNELSGIAPVHVSDISSIDDCLVLIEEYGSIFKRENKASMIIDHIIQSINDFQEKISSKSIEKVAYFIWKDPWMVAGKATFIDHLLRVNKFENVVEQDRYPEVSLETFLKQYNPDLIFLSSEPFPFKQKHIIELERLTNAKIQLVDGEYFSWYGSRLLKPFDYFKTLIY